MGATSSHILPLCRPIKPYSLCSLVLLTLHCLPFPAPVHTRGKRSSLLLHLAQLQAGLSKLVLNSLVFCSQKGRRHPCVFSSFVRASLSSIQEQILNLLENYRQIVNLLSHTLDLSLLCASPLAIALESNCLSSLTSEQTVLRSVSHVYFPHWHLLGHVVAI